MCVHVHVYACMHRVGMRRSHGEGVVVSIAQREGTIRPLGKKAALEAGMLRKVENQARKRGWARP